MEGSSVPLGTQAGVSVEDRSPDLRFPLSCNLPEAMLQWLSEIAPAETLFAFTRKRSAHSCGAVADLHRLPEHPDDCGCTWSARKIERQGCHEM